MGEFRMSRYHWRAHNVTNWKSYRVPPRTLDSSAAETMMLPLIYCVRHCAAMFDGWPITDTQFDLLNCTAANRLRLFDILGPDENEQCSFYILPSSDVSPTKGQ
jgi:hypothetical protein